MNSFMSWIGGKKALRDEILARFPLDYKRYIEVFGGGGWVISHSFFGLQMNMKPPSELVKSTGCIL